VRAGFDLAAIHRLLSDFAWAADRGLADELSALFFADGTLRVNDQEFRGRSAIADDCRRRAEIAHRRTRHVWSNLRVDTREDGACDATLVQLTYESLGADQPLKLRVNDVRDRLERGADGRWRFRSRVIERQMALLMPNGAEPLTSA